MNNYNTSACFCSLYLFQQIFCFNIVNKNSIEKITKMSHNTVFFRSVFNAKCIFLCLGAHEFIYYNFSGLWFSIINSLLFHNIQSMDFKPYELGKTKRFQRNKNVSWSLSQKSRAIFCDQKKMFFAHINWITFTTKQNKTNVYSFSQLSAKYYCDFHVSSLHTNDNCVQFVVFKTVSSEFPKTDRSTQKQTDQQPRTMRLHLFFWLLKTDRLTKKRYADAWVETNAARRRLSRNNP